MQADLGFVARVEVSEVGNADQILGLLIDGTRQGFQQVTDVVTEVDPLECLADEPRGRVVENRHLLRTDVPPAVLEFVDPVARLAAEEASQTDVAACHHMHRQVVGSRRHPVGVIATGHPNQKPTRVDAGLRSEADQAAGQLIADPVVTTNIV